MLITNKKEKKRGWEFIIHKYLQNKLSVFHHCNLVVLPNKQKTLKEAKYKLSRHFVLEVLITN